MMTRRRYTTEDDTKIVALKAEGKSFGEIALLIGREKTSVAGRYNLLKKTAEAKNEIPQTTHQ